MDGVGSTTDMTVGCAIGRRSPWLLRAVLAWLLLASLAGGCARARAADVPVGPPLAVPAPPARVLAPVEEAPLAASPGRTDTAIAAPEVSQQPPPAPVNRSSADRVRQSSPPPAPAAAPAPTPPPAEVQRQVQLQSAPEGDALRVEVVQLLSTVKANLNRLGSGADTKRVEEIRILMAEAEKALLSRNYSYAKIQANKAVTLSSDLLR